MQQRDKVQQQQMCAPAALLHYVTAKAVMVAA
jgi:hypothetical protein